MSALIARKFSTSTEEVSVAEPAVARAARLADGLDLPTSVGAPELQAQLERRLNAPASALDAEAPRRRGSPMFAIVLALPPSMAAWWLIAKGVGLLLSHH
jgi:hypothetical protein